MIKQIEPTHKGLGIPILYCNLSILSNVSNILIGEKGQGKTRVVKSVKTPSQENSIQLDTATMKEIILKLNGGDNVKKLRDQNIFCSIEDFTTLSSHHKEVFLGWFSKIITDHNFYHDYGSSRDNPLIIDIKDCNLTILVGMTPLSFQRIMTENEIWQSISDDRFLKFFMINPIRQQSLDESPTYEMDFNKWYDQEPKIDTDFSITKHMLFRQVTQHRNIQYCRRLLRTYCKYEGYDTINRKAELEFKKLFEVYLKLIPDFTYTNDIERKPTIAIGALRLLEFICDCKAEGKEPTLSYALETFGVYKTKMFNETTFDRSERYQETLKKHISILEEKELANVYNSTPTLQLSEKLMNFFDWYKGI